MRPFLWRVIFFTLLSQLSAYALANNINSTTTNSHDGNYTISWSGFPSSSVFGVYLYENNIEIGGGSGTSGSHTFTNKANGTYTYYVKGCGQGCIFSSSITVTVNKTDNATQKPPTPSLTVTSSANTHALSWTENIYHDDLSRYEVEVSLDGKNFTRLYHGLNLNFSHSPLANGGYSYRIRACITQCSNWETTNKFKIGEQSDIHYQYDALGRLVKVTAEAFNKTDYEYDHAGNRTHVK